MTTSTSFSNRLLHWFDANGRKDLPWQQNISAYRVWVSEIMLQQTQVTTVIPYYQRFMERFPSVEALASAHIDEVLALWTGLGYYARARNLHKSAQMICSEFAGAFPDTPDTLQALPGIGRSTAAAIYAIAYTGHAAILDGNVKRVLTRYAAVEGWPGAKPVENTLWQLAESLTPKKRVADYTQAIMDLGATLCTRSKPQCERCPMHSDCQAYAANTVSDFPTKKPRKTIPVRQTVMLFIENSHGEILLEQRPSSGIWGGLWSPIELHLDDNIADTLEQRLQLQGKIQHWPVLRHTFSHFHLDITPVHIKTQNQVNQIMEGGQQLWYKGHSHQQIGLAAPVKKLLDQLLETN